MDTQALAYQSTTELDIINFAGNFGFEICKFGHEWSTLFNKAKYGGLVLLLGACGRVVYLLSKKHWRGDGEGGNRDPSQKSFVKWLFEEELLEDFGEETNVFGRYFGPDPSLDGRLSSDGDADGENDSEDLSLNSLTSSPSSRKLLKTPATISHPCPRCDKGVCRLKRHLASRTSSTPSSSYSSSPHSCRPVQTSTPDTEEPPLQRTHALGRLFHRGGAVLRQDGDGQERRQDEASSSPSSDLSPRFRRRPGRGGADGKELWCLSPVSRVSPLASLPREDSMDSIVEPLSTLSVCGSMLDMVTNARDVRRLIRGMSIDSQDSDYSLDLDMDSELGASTAEGLDLLTTGVGGLMDKCDSIEGEMEAMPPSSMVTSRSSMSGLSSLAATEDGATSLHRENSIPDLRQLRRASRQQRGIWKLTNFSSVSEVESSAVSEAGSLEWDSPRRGWHAVHEVDVEESEESLAESVVESAVESRAGSVGDPWEWDHEWGAQDSLPISQLDGLALPWTGQELDLEAELRRRSLSGSSSLDLVRQPPSGCSSSSGSRRSRASSISSVTCPPLSSSKARASPSSSCSDESGFLGSEALDSSFTSSMNSSSIFTSSINLSPVREAREPTSVEVDRILSPSSPEIFGDFETTDTVIKISKDSHRPREHPSLPRGLFPGSGAEDVQDSKP